MGIRQYIASSFIFLLIIGVYVYTFEGASYTHSFFGRELTMPIALWALIPAGILFLATIFHLFYYSVKGFFAKRVIKKDFETLVTEIKNNILGEEKPQEYKSEYFTELGKISKKLVYNPESNDEKVGNSTLDEIFEKLHKVYSGEYIDLKKLRLRNDNPITVKNRMNLLKGDPKALADALKQCDVNSDEFCKKAFDVYTTTASYEEIKKYNFTLSNDIVIKLFKRFADKNDTFNIPNADIECLLEKTKLSEDEYISCAKMLKANLEPNILLSIFENLQQKNSDATNAYLYLLFELQMIDKIREFLSNANDDEYEKFKILLFLRDHGKRVDADLII
ncbi:MAG: hypothetical protein ACK5LP_06625 [Campylobacteraceae bacterium]